LKFGEGITAEDIELSAIGYDAIFIVKETGERVTVYRWYYSSSFQLTSVEFADGTQWTRADINAMSPITRGTDGDDTINTGSTNDTIYGGAGDDTINGGYGNDILIGEAGDDTLAGGNGYDVYIWNLGDGNDTINDSGGYGVLKFGDSINPENIILTRSGNNAVFTVGESGEQISVFYWYASSNYQLTGVEFADGTVWSRADVNGILAGTIEPFSTASMSTSTYESASAFNFWDSETTDAFDLLSSFGNDELSASLFGFGTEETELSASDSFSASQQDMDMDLALALLGFGETSDQTGDTFGNTSDSTVNQAYVSTGGGSSSSCYFENQDDNALSA
jgi:hypothetical protein